MTRYTRYTTLLALLATLALAASADAQVSLSFGLGNGGGANGNGGYMTIGGGRSIGLPNPNARPPRHWNRPNRRFVTTPQVTHFDPWSGTVHTQNQEVFESVSDFGRDQSRNNGTMRRVNRPIYDHFGNLTGYEQGVEWRNSLTGQRHHETVKTTVNNNPWGGVHHTNSSRSYGSPMVNHTTSTQSVSNQSSTRSVMAPQINRQSSVGAPAP